MSGFVTISGKPEISNRLRSKLVAAFCRLTRVEAHGDPRDIKRCENNYKQYINGDRRYIVGSKRFRDDVFKLQRAGYVVTF